jgi:hypothetical protein
MRYVCRMLVVAAVTGLCLASPGLASAGHPFDGTPTGPGEPEPAFVPCQTDALIAAIGKANTEGGGTLWLAPRCRYTLTRAQPGTDSGLPAIAAPIEIHGRGATITRSTAAGTAEFRIFEVLGAPGALTISRTTITNGASIGDQVPGDGHSGGGILVRETGTLTATMVTVTGNSGFVGGIHNYGTARISRSSVSDNTGVWGGGLNNTGGRLTLSGVTVSGNLTQSDIGVGGGIFNSAGATTVVERSLVSHNLGINNGGGIHNEGSLHVTGSVVFDNRAASLFGAPVTVQGGGIYNAGTATIVATTISHNQSQRQESPTATVAIAGGIANDGTESPGVTLTLDRTLVVDNTSVDEPGGINNDAAAISLQGSLVTRNSPTNCEGSPTPVPGCDA